MTRTEFGEYSKAVDEVCVNCSFGEETCPKCPVRITYDDLQNSVDD